MEPKVQTQFRQDNWQRLNEGLRTTNRQGLNIELNRIQLNYWTEKYIIRIQIEHRRNIHSIWPNSAPRIRFLALRSVSLVTCPWNQFIRHMTCGTEYPAAWYMSPRTWLNFYQLDGASDWFVDGCSIVRRRSKRLKAWKRLSSRAAPVVHLIPCSKW